MGKTDFTYYKEMNSRKTVPERWWNIYLNDDGCKKNFNGLHLVCALYGDDEEDSDTLMQSMAGNKHYQLENLEFSSDDSLFNDTISSCMWNDQYPEGYFAHLHSQLGSKLKMLELERKNDEDGVQTWENWGWMIYQCDAKLSYRNTDRELLTKQQKSELQNRLKYYHGEERNGKIVVKDWYNPWMSREAEEYANYISGGWQR